MNNRHEMVYAGLATLLLASCGSDSSSAGYSGGAVRACEIVPGAEISRLVGAALIETNVDVERTAGNDSFSQCTHTLDGDLKRVTVQVRTSDAPMGMLRQSDADVLRSADDSTGYSVKMAEAMDAGTDISGLGDAAYSYEFGETLFLVVLKDRHVKAQVWVPIGKAGNARAMEVARTIAAEVLKQL